MKPAVLTSFPERFNMADYFLYHNLEEGRENKVCLYFEDQKWTYGEVARLSNQTGNALRELGANIEDRVLLVLPDCPEFVWTWFGAARIGTVITMVNPLLPAADYEYYLDYTRAKVAVVHQSVLKTFAEAAARRVTCEGCWLLVTTRNCPIEHRPVVWILIRQVVNAASAECMAADTRRDDIAIWLFTSGSTGHPKGAVHLQHDLPFNTEVFAKATMGVNAGRSNRVRPEALFWIRNGHESAVSVSRSAAPPHCSLNDRPRKRCLKSSNVTDRRS